PKAANTCSGSTWPWKTAFCIWWSAPRRQPTGPRTVQHRRARRIGLPKGSSSRARTRARRARLTSTRSRPTPTMSHRGSTGARCLLAEGGSAEADKVYRGAMDECGREPLLLFNRGVLLEDLGNTAAALAAYQAAIEEDPDLADCHYNLARLYEELGKPQHAI